MPKNSADYLQLSFGIGGLECQWGRYCSSDSAFIKSQIGVTLYDINGRIHSSPEVVLAF